MDSSNTSRPAGWTSCLLHALVYLVSLLPLWFLYGLSDLFFLLAYYLIRYRRRIVRSNLCGSFPEKTEREIVAIERRFYRFFCDYMVETVKLCSMSDREMRRRMRFAGVEQMVGALEREGKLFAFIYLAHYGNWEWVSSLSARVREVNPGITGGHIYHPLRNKPLHPSLDHFPEQADGRVHRHRTDSAQGRCSTVLCPCGTCQARTLSLHYRTHGGQSGADAAVRHDRRLFPPVGGRYMPVSGHMAVDAQPVETHL